MLAYLWKRLLLFIPALWLITSLVFLLSHLADDPASSGLLNDEQIRGTSGNSRPELQYRLLRQYLSRTGQDRPVFYFHLRSLAQPDTLDWVFPQTHRKFLQRLIQQYGKWPKISRFYQEMVRLQTITAELPPTAARNLIQQIIARMYASGVVPPYLSQIEEIGHKLPDPTQLLSVLAACRNNYERMAAKPQPWRNCVPVLHWNGADNQYHRWFINLLTGNWGQSVRDARPVLDLLHEAFTNTLLLMLTTLLITFVGAVALAVWLILPAQARWRPLVLNTLYTLDSVPLFLMALLLLMALSGTGLLSIFPVYGLGTPDASVNWLEYLLNQLYYLTVPILCLSLTTLPYLASQTFRALQQVASMEYIQTARAKGLPEIRVMGRHALRNALLPLITLLTGFLPLLISGALVIEVIFAIPGMGRLLADSVLARDYPVIMGIVLCLAFVKMSALWLADALYYLADPRIRYQ